MAFYKMNVHLNGVTGVRHPGDIVEVNEEQAVEYAERIAGLLESGWASEVTDVQAPMDPPVKWPPGG